MLRELLNPIIASPSLLMIVALTPGSATVLRTARAPYSKSLAQPCVPLSAFVGESLDLVEALVYQVLC